ncbi:MAG: YggS family pyridoxal phosphate-dependent enzyme [Gammaproteobacteria bacterium]
MPAKPNRIEPPAAGLECARETIARLGAAHGRAVGSIRLVAVSKKQPAEKVAAAARAGQCDFAENYLQEGIEKIDRVAGLLQAAGRDARYDDGHHDVHHEKHARAPLCWHFIGHMQSRKCREIAARFDWVHTVDSIKVAEKLNSGRAGRAPLNALIQLNLQDEASKSGVCERDLPALADGIANLPHLRLRGLMIIPRPQPDCARRRAVFRRCRELRDALNARGFAVPHLSMGMSDDLEAAIAEGATMLRLGTAVFGPRAE